ncbi:flagellar basal body-associated FliL family protein [Treponema brennaborense]|uniref:Flagellar protein FliL n=1 Tax=Treponema brennaborense (strain DSM 12168 / CIP 105900 / DD5/3) TaxID=906968 RepID=F4LPM8_TREBD|nr:flagellar basal body-associated FliL family protein [Treponema brennaborense]AEE17024.1 flagellar basal body-associated protein FliL [Treponema brennaborense DSM 12168]
MADDDLGLDDNGESGGAAEKKRGIGGLFPALLKWVAIVLGAIILIVTVVVITMKIMGGNSAQQAAIPVSQDYVGKREILDWYSSIGSIRTKTSDSIPASVVVEVVLGYKKDDKATSTEITARQIEIKDFLRRYFTEKKISELRPQNEDKLRIEIRNAINDDILSSSKIKDVRFLSLEIIEQ